MRLEPGPDRHPDRISDRPSRRCTAEDINRDELDALLKRFRFTGKEPLREDIFSALNTKPKVLQRKTIYERIVAKLKDLVHTFDDGMGDL